jgi:hypothetical protein
MFISPQMWWIIDVGFSHVLDEKNATQAQKKYLHLDCQATNIFYQSMTDKIFGEIMYMKTAHDIWLYLNLIYGRVSDDDDDDESKEGHEYVEHDHNSVIVEDCSTSWSSDDDDRSTTSSLDKVDDDATSDANDDATHAHLLMMVHARALRVMLLQALHHHIASYHKVTQRYKKLMWLIMLIHMMSFLVYLLA